ncbi:MAG: lysophospholipase [Bdellovibrionaceae bacterium]|nr:lysophospholipase [Bdellovibrionales bacterium]MCB9084751.1 lysophospholipase [Pseudobdellovibrionaceae bacterium]
MKRFETTFNGTKGTELFYQTWQVPNPVGTLVVTHGLAEHSECYHDFALVMTKAKWNVVGWDMRGHGRSEGKRGYVEDFGDYVSDLRLLSEHLFEQEKLAAKGPVVCFAHSMGGLIALRAMVNFGDMGYRAMALSAPLLGVGVDVPKAKEKIAQWAGRWLPKLTLYNEIRYEDLSRDEEVLKAYERDPLRHDKISPHVFLGMLENMQVVIGEAGQIQIPVLLQLSGHDKIVSTPVAENFFELLSTPKKYLQIYPDSYHEIYNDLDKDLAFRHLKEFLSELV